MSAPNELDELFRLYDAMRAIHRRIKSSGKVVNYSDMRDFKEAADAKDAWYRRNDVEQRA